MATDYEPSAELHELLQAAAEGDLDDAAGARLGEIVREDPQARAFYVDYMSVHALLGWRHGAVPPLEMPLSVPASRDRKPAADRVPNVLWLTAAVLLIAVLAVVFAFGTGSGNGKPVAVVVEEEDAQRSDGTKLNINDTLPAGRHRLAAGEARIALSSGVLIAMAGPVDFDISTPQRIHLRRGKLHIYSPLAARGFTVTTPRGVQIVDLGTRFGVWVTDDNTVEVQLFDGELEINGTRKLLSPQGVLVDAQGSIVDVPVDAEQFPTLHGVD